MKNLLFTIKILIIFILLTIGKSVAQPNYLNEGIDFFKKNEFEKSKILFERNLVFDPRSEKSYLWSRTRPWQGSSAKPVE